MIGNDIVDLSAARAESNWERPGFLHKIFSTTETEYILNSDDPAKLVWTYWTMKEAAYKIHSNKTGVRCFAPAKLYCEIDEACHFGTVTYDGCLYYIQSNITEEYIHTIASKSQDKLEEIKIEIIVHNGILPNYRIKNPTCVSHHGNYLALVY